MVHAESSKLGWDHAGLSPGEKRQGPGSWVIAVVTVGIVGRGWAVASHRAARNKSVLGQNVRRMAARLARLSGNAPLESVPQLFFTNALAFAKNCR